MDEKWDAINNPSGVGRDLLHKNVYHDSEFRRASSEESRSLLGLSVSLKDNTPVGGVQMMIVNWGFVDTKNKLTFVEREKRGESFTWLCTCSEKNSFFEDKDIEIGSYYRYRMVTVDRVSDKVLEADAKAYAEQRDLHAEL